ncbi:hypothetical protein [Stenotrophomonas sp.]|uniref:hypothetical protein n=1 Tax=Stenotrophomonas sp. TaxID=69392 RepID=UPI00289B733C|nr:hypothetical protein [Stenotrophomonas sp.]
MTTLYLDHNVLIDIQKRRREDLVARINGLNRSAFDVVFSPAHIEEVAALRMHHGHADEVAPFLDFLSRLTHNRVLLPYPRRSVAQVEQRGIYLSVEHPSETFGRVIGNYGNNAFAEAHQREKITSGIAFGETHGVDSRTSNTMDIAHELDALAPKLIAILDANIAAMRGSPLAPYLPSCAPSRSQLSFAHLARYFPVHEVVIEKVFEFMDLLNYYPNKPKQYLSGLHDTTHAIYAAYCDVFVTNDAGLRHRTLAAYHWLGVKTRVFTGAEFVEYLDARNASTASA